MKAFGPEFAVPCGDLAGYGLRRKPTSAYAALIAAITAAFSALHAALSALSALIAALLAAIDAGSIDARPAFVAGHSLGEYAALIAAGAWFIFQGR